MSHSVALQYVLGNELQSRRDEVTEDCWWIVCTGYHGEARRCRHLHQQTQPDGLFWSEDNSDEGIIMSFVF